MHLIVAKNTYFCLYTAICGAILSGAYHLCLIILNNHFGRENDSLNALLCTMAAVEFYVRFTFTKKISDLVLALIGTMFVILSLVAYVTAVVSGA